MTVLPRTLVDRRATGRRAACSAHLHGPAMAPRTSQLEPGRGVPAMEVIEACLPAAQVR